MYGLGIVKGKEDNQYDPKGTTTRGETASFILNMLLVIETGSVQNVIGTAEINGIGVNIEVEQVQTTLLLERQVKAKKLQYMKKRTVG